jgi:hypothetical protein
LYSLREGIPDLFVDALRFGEFGDRGLHLVAKFVGTHLGAPEADDGELGGQQPLLDEAVERRDEFAFGEVARRAEDDDGAGLGGAFQPDALAQGVVLNRGDGYFSLHLESLYESSPARGVTLVNDPSVSCEPAPIKFSDCFIDDQHKGSARRGSLEEQRSEARD